MRHGVKVFAWRPIDKGDEITIDYRLNAFDGDSWTCECGSAYCTGTVVGSFFAMSADRQALLLPHAPAVIGANTSDAEDADTLPPTAG